MSKQSFPKAKALHKGKYTNSSMMPSSADNDGYAVSYGSPGPHGTIFAIAEAPGSPGGIPVGHQLAV